MLDMMDGVRKSLALSSDVKLNVNTSKYVNKAIAAYKRTSGEVSHSEQVLLDPSYVNEVQAVSNVTENHNHKIGSLINIYV